MDPSRVLSLHKMKGDDKLSGASTQLTCVRFIANDFPVDLK